MTGSLQVKNDKFYMVLNSTENGKRKQKWISTGLPVKGNKRKAEQMLRETLRKYETQAGIVHDDVRFSDYIRLWLEQTKKRVDEVTYQGYDTLAQTHILPYFDALGIRLQEVTTKVLQAYFDEKRVNGRLDGKGGLSPKSLRLHKNVLFQALTDAVRNQLLSSNPCQFVQLPQKERKEAHFYSATQMQTLFATLQNDPLLPLVKITAIYGLRRSELLGLQFWKTEFDGKTPLEYARERALTKCYEQNLQMLLAEKMLSQESSFQAIQNAYTEYISSRNSAKDTTAIYYGPSELEFRDFYNYFLSNQKNAVLAAMRANGTVTENEVSLYYTKMRDLLYSIDPAYEFMVISFDEIAEKSDQSSEIEAVRNEVLNGTKVEDLDIKHEGIRIEEYTLNGHSGMGIQATAAPYISSIEKLHDGEISDVLFNSRNGFYLIYMNARKEGRILEYDEVHNRIEASLLEHAYETELANIREETPMIVS